MDSIKGYHHEWNVDEFVNIQASVNSVTVMSMKIVDTRLGTLSDIIVLANFSKNASQTR